MKKVIKISILFFFILWLIPVIKNIYLYFNYNHFNNALLKVKDDNPMTIGKWEGKYDPLIDSFDTRQILTIYHYKDSTGLFVIKELPYRINKSIAELYSWTSLLPFDDKRANFYKYKINVKKDYFYYIIKIKSDYGIIHQDTIYNVYKISNDSLYINHIELDDIEKLPNTKLSYSYFDKLNEFDLWDWNYINPFMEYKNLFKEIF
ncbi:MAG: hypothetical protein IPJ23_06075 [Ignavibacteriales bacterium]|nr:hypothetical protein [Ignavibacteriales bacterium]